MGDGDYAAILDISTAKSNGRHFHIPAAAEKKLAPEDLHYLSLKGCFTLPDEYEALITAYFRYAHPMFPVIDGASFLGEYNVHGVKGVNLLLLWSMFSVAASYVPSLNQKQCKEDYTYRAKLLFDLSNESDKCVLIQSALLLSFWWAEAEDVKHSWYWTSVAFAMAQTLGLHRGFKSTPGSDSVDCRTWRIVWRCCMLRDVWLSFGMGRPLRINISDCDPLVLQDTPVQFESHILHDEVVYSAYEAVELVDSWRKLNMTADFLRKIMDGTKITPSQATVMKDSLSVEPRDTVSSILEHVYWHLQLHQYAASVALARNIGSKGESVESSDRMTAIIRKFIEYPKSICPAPFSVPLVVPAITTYLGTMASASPEDRKLTNDKLDTMFLFLGAVEDNYPAASIVHRICSVSRKAVEAQIGGLHVQKASRFASQDDLTLAATSNWLADSSFGP